MLSEILERNRSISPLVHCISNYVTANDCVNLLLASGASAIMADDAEEVEEITAMCQALVLNLGTPNPRRLEAMLKAGKAAGRRLPAHGTSRTLIPEHKSRGISM